MYGKIFALLGLLWFVSNSNQPLAQDVVAKRVTKEEFKKKLESLDDYQLVDVRTVGEFQRGTIKGAVNIDYTASNFSDMIQKLDKKKPTLIFCQAGGRSAAALKKMESLGFQYVLELEGGYGGWIK